MLETANRASLDDLRQTPEYQRLTEKQQLWISSYVSSGVDGGKYDSITATTIAYHCKTPEIARVMSYSVLANIRIVAVLNLHFKTTPLQELLTLIERAIHNKKTTPSQVAALKLKCRVLGFDNGVPDNLMDLAKVRQQENAKRVKPGRVRRPESPTKRVSPIKEYGF